MTNGSVGKHRNVDHFSVKILKIQHAESLTNVPLSEIRNVDHLSVKISMAAMSAQQDVDHFSVRILKLRHYTELLTSPVFIFNFTKAVVLTFFTAKERISMLWGFPLIFSCQIFVSLVFCVITTLFQISSNLKTNYSNFKRCEVYITPTEVADNMSLVMLILEEKQ